MKICWILHQKQEHNKHDTHFLMLIFIAASMPTCTACEGSYKAPSYSVRRYAWQEWSTTKCQRILGNRGDRPVHGGKAVQFSVRMTTHSHQSFTVIQHCTCFHHQYTQKTAPSTKPIHLGSNSSSKSKDGNIENDTTEFWHMLCSSSFVLGEMHIWTKTGMGRPPGSNTACPWAGTAASQPLRHQLHGWVCWAG